MQSSNFFAMMSRMKHIDRWGLMHNTRKENLSEHSLDVAMIAHCLGAIHNILFEDKVDPERLCVLGIYHDASEIITGDLPTPIKYRNETLRSAYKDVEKEACETMLSLVPSELNDTYSPLFLKNDYDKKHYSLLKAADKISALIKCIEEENTGNKDFSKAKKSQIDALDAMDMAEIRYFFEKFIPSFSLTLDDMREEK